jgi:hypothetical protein
MTTWCLTQPQALEKDRSQTNLQRERGVSENARSPQGMFIVDPKMQVPVEDLIKGGMVVVFQ